MKHEIVLDAANGMLGRIASFAVKNALLGKKVVIVNCESARISGRKQFTLKTYKIKRARGGASMRGPHFPKNPERIMKRTIRGMLPYKQQRGLEAFKSIMCYNDTPQEYHNVQKVNMARPLKGKGISLKELSETV